MNEIRNLIYGVTEVHLGENRWCKVDFHTWPRLSRYSWHAQVHRQGAHIYACSSLGLMHRIVANALKGQQIDHINRDGLDNRLCNLRLATSQQNRANSQRERHNESGLKGVSWSRTSSKWTALVVHKGKRYYLGVFVDKRRAAMAVDRMALALNGEYAGLNYPHLRNHYRLPAVDV